MLSAVFILLLSVLAVLGAVQLVRVVAVARSRVQVRDFFAGDEGDSRLEREANTLRQQAERLRRSRSVDAPMKLLLARIIDDLLRVVAEEKDRRRQAKKLMELQQHYEDLVHSARAQLAATNAEQGIFAACTRTLADAEEQQHAVAASLTALNDWRAELELSAGELIRAARQTLARAQGGKVHTDLVTELTDLQRSAAELLKKVLDS